MLESWGNKRWLGTFACALPGIWAVGTNNVPTLQLRVRARGPRVNAHSTVFALHAHHDASSATLDRAQVRRHLGVAPASLGHDRPIGATTCAGRRRARAGGRVGV